MRKFRHMISFFSGGLPHQPGPAKTNEALSIAFARMSEHDYFFRKNDAHYEPWKKSEYWQGRGARDPKPVDD
jgi:hypothetical protein